MDLRACDPRGPKTPVGSRERSGAGWGGRDGSAGAATSAKFSAGLGRVRGGHHHCSNIAVQLRALRGGQLRLGTPWRNLDVTLLLL